MKRNVVSIDSKATIREAAYKMTSQHIGLLPVVDEDKNLIGVIGLPEILSLEMPAFFSLLGDLDFVSDFGAVETTRPTAEEIDRPVTELMQSSVSVDEDCGLLMAYAMMLKHNLSDLPVVSETGKLVGVVSRVDIGTTILANWKQIEG
jgi:CBS domain-containing protein